MNLDESESELKAAVEHLIHCGSHYEIDRFATLYAPELQIIIVDPANNVMVLDYEQNLAFFKSKRQAGASPLEETAEFIHLDVSGDYGYVVVVRHVALEGRRQKVVFSLNLRKSAGTWRVFRETAVIVGDA